MQTIRKQHRGDLSRPSVDELTNVTGSAYSLVNVAAKRARQLTAFHAGLGEGLLEYAGPAAGHRPSQGNDFDEVLLLDGAPDFPTLFETMLTSLTEAFEQLGSGQLVSPPDPGHDAVTEE